MLENRRHFRLREFMDVTWKLEGQDVSGDGLVMNISSSGLLLQTDRVFRPADDSILYIESGDEPLPFASKKGRLVWFRRIHTPQERFQCGIQFLTERLDPAFGQWLENKINQLSEVGDANILGNLAF